MTNHLTWETLNDLVDGVLSADAKAAVESHAAGCARCATALAELRATVTEARALPKSVSPPDELWADVRATIEASKVARLPSGAAAPAARGWWVTPRQLAAAAAVLIVATASLTGVVMNSRSSSTIAARPQAAVTVAWQSSEKVFQENVVQLRQQLEMLHDHLSPETLVKVERALATVDLAIAEGREALLRDPANAALSELLASNYRQKIELLRRVTQLASS